MGNLVYIVTFLSALLLSAVLVPLCMKAARKFGILDKPDRNLKKHKAPTPYLGGVAIFLSFFIVLFLQRLIVAGTLKGLNGIIIGGSLIFFLGLVDDIKKLQVWQKFLVQAVAAVILIVCHIQVQFLGNDILNIIVTVLWVVGITNAFNLLDIMDGLSSGVAFIAAMAFFVIGMEGGKFFTSLASLALAGSVLGYWFYNFPPAKIFMGDAGSLFLGFTLAALSITESYSFNNRFAVLTPIFLLGVPIFDTFFVMWLRLKQRRPVYFGSPDHFVLRLLRSGLSNKQIIAIVYCVCLVLSVLGFVSTRLSEPFSITLYSAIFLISIYAANKLSKIG